MKKILIAMTAAAMFSSSGVWAAFFSGNDIIESCEAQTSQCAAFMVGVSDTVQALSADDDVTLHPIYTSCVPVGATAGQLARIMAKHMNENPQYLTDNAASLAMLALHQAFPCE